VDCLERRCSGSLKDRIPDFPPLMCENISILKLNESESFGPFFARYLASKMWRGETYFMQIDAHTHFKDGWDSNLIAQLKQTPSYPHSVISNYPPSFDEGVDDWPDDTPTGLCEAHFTTDDHVLRLEMTFRDFKTDASNGVPRHSLFVAAGFFFARSEFLSDVPYDPFLPFLFMGEEIIMSARLWTSGVVFFDYSFCI
jgi:[Skp1-protein]-hydroxyproline N-acetylglucosaminyltransferase